MQEVRSAIDHSRDREPLKNLCPAFKLSAADSAAGSGFGCTVFHDTDRETG